MTTPMAAYAAVARLLAVQPVAGETEVHSFWTEAFPEMAPDIQELVFDFLVSATDVPSAQELTELQRAIAAIARQRADSATVTARIRDDDEAPRAAG